MTEEKAELIEKAVELTEMFYINELMIFILGFV